MLFKRKILQFLSKYYQIIFVLLIISGLITAVIFYFLLVKTNIDTYVEIEKEQPTLENFLEILGWNLTFPLVFVVFVISMGYIYYLIIRNLDYVFDLEKKVTERTKELTEANERLKELDLLKDMFIASMSHEFRTPLTPIKGLTKVLLKRWSGEINEEQENHLTIILKSANHLHQLINKVIDVSKIAADKIDIRKERYNLVDELLTLKELFLVTAERKGLKFLIDNPEHLTIYNDKQRINQILINLIGNAIKFTDKGEVSVKIQRSDRNVEISVEDTGPGIRDEDLEKLFKPFSRIIEPGKFKEGTGLGLHISKKLANKLGGDIVVKSEFGKGSIFTLIIEFDEKIDRITRIF